MLIAAMAVVTLAMLALVTWPLLRRSGTAASRALYDRAVARDQINELERDVTRGLIGEREYTTARIEIERRLLAVDAAAPPPHVARSPLLAGVVVLAVGGIAGGLYAWLGAPTIPSAPSAGRVVAPEPSPTQAHDVDKAVATLGDRLKNEPGNIEGWSLYARTLGSLGRWEQSAAAYQHLVGLVPEDGDAQADYGEAQVMVAQGMVTPGAVASFTAALKHDPTNVVARYYLAAADAQAGEPARAIEGWSRLAADTPEDSPLRTELATRMSETAARAGLPKPVMPPGKPAQAAAAPKEGAPGPDSSAVAAAAQMPPEQRNAMIRDMVAQLAARQEADPSNFDGWLRLGRAYVVLGEMDKADSAYGRAAALKPGDPNVPLAQAEALMQGLTPESPVPPRVVSLLHKVEAAEPNRPEVLWLLGMAAAQAHHRDEAEGYWRRLLAALPEGAEERKMVEGALNALTAAK
jgi:cytochrome c-type biogenesis protein CcmH